MLLLLLLVFSSSCTFAQHHPHQHPYQQQQQQQQQQYLFMYSCEDDSTQYPSSFHGLNSQILDWWQNAAFRFIELKDVAATKRLLVEPHVHVALRNSSWFERDRGNMNPDWNLFRKKGILKTITDPLRKYADLAALPFSNGIASVNDMHEDTGGKIAMNFCGSCSQKTSCGSNSSAFAAIGKLWTNENVHCDSGGLTLSDLRGIVSNSTDQKVIAIEVAWLATLLVRESQILPPSNSDFNLLPFPKSLIDRAKAFVAAKLPEPFLAIHWRRGDRGFYLERQGPGFIEYELTSPRRMVRYLKQKLEEWPVRYVFMATNSGDEEAMEYIRKEIEGAVHLVRYNGSGRDDDSLEESVIEQVVSLYSCHYVTPPANRGNPWLGVSAFSKRVLIHREALGINSYSVCCGDEPAMAVFRPLPNDVQKAQFSNDPLIEVVILAMYFPDDVSPFLEIWRNDHKVFQHRLTAFTSGGVHTTCRPIAEGQHEVAKMFVARMKGLPGPYLLKAQATNNQGIRIPNTEHVVSFSYQVD